MTTPANRFVVAPDPQGRSAVLLRGLTNVQSRERLHWSGAGFPMHHTDTLDCLTCERGEIYLVTDTDEVLMQHAPENPDPQRD